MSRPRDMQIFWIVLFAGSFWAAIWQHDQVSKLAKTVFTAAVAITSNFRGTPSSEAAPAEDSHPAKAQRPSSQPAPKRSPEPADSSQQ
jgi:hypothetical protein